MRILAVHADYIEIEVKSKAIQSAERISDSDKKVRYDEVLVVFTAVESSDTKDMGYVLCNEIISICEKVHTKNVLLYPLVHLTNSPASPNLALYVIKDAERILNEKGYNTAHAPFGWYKAYTIRCKGHPLSELSRVIESTAEKVHTTFDISASGEGKESKSLVKERKLVTTFYIMDLSGNLIPIDEFDFSKYPNLKAFVKYESEKSRVYDKEPPHIKIMKEHRLIDYEPGSDPGNFRFLPKGRLIKKILEHKITDICVSYGAVEVETPIMYDFEHPSLKSYLDRFPARHYIVLSDDKKLFLRFAACFGQFLIAHDSVMTYKSMPFKMFELTRYSFRREQSGELAGLKRLRAFTMPDMHTFVADMDQAKMCFEEQLKLGIAWNKELGINTEVGFRVLKSFFDENREWYVKMVKGIGKPVMFEIFDERYAYFITKFEFNFVDAMHKASALTTVQIDVENAENYDISYVDKDGEKKRPIILHASLSGSLERVIYALLESQYMAKGKKPMLPVWLSPVQVRVIPIAGVHIKKALNVYNTLSKGNVRADVDDRIDLTLSKRIREAEKEWIPYIIVIGDKEMNSTELPVSIRSSGKRESLSLSAIISRISKECEGQPLYPFSMSYLLSSRPKL